MPALNSESTESPGLLFVGDWLPVVAPQLPDLGGRYLAVGNLECAFGASASIGKAYSVVLPPDKLNLAWISKFAALSVANNHTADAGAAAFDDMVRRIEDTTPTQLYGRSGRPFAEIAVGAQKWAVIGCLERSRGRPRFLVREEDVVSIMREIVRDYDRVYITPHWGKEGEFTSYPAPRQRRMARMWIEEGAAGIIGHHAHVVHGRETISGRPVFYSVGNLAFPHPEGDEYPLTRLGIAVAFDSETSCMRPSLSWLLRSGRAEYQMLSDTTCANEYLESVSRELVNGPWTAWRWCRAVGPTYIRKSMRSWRRRMRGPGFVKQAGLFLGWLGQPSTIALLIGWLWPNRRLADIAHTLERAVETDGKAWNI